MKELFQSKKTEEDEESQAQGFYKKFTNQGPAYFGDLDEVDETLLQFEIAAEEEGMPRNQESTHNAYSNARMGGCLFAFTDGTSAPT